MQEKEMICAECGKTFKAYRARDYCGLRCFIKNRRIKR